MKFLLDQGVPRSAVAELKSRGNDAQHVGDLGMSRATDQEIIDAAIRDDSTVVTMDADFHALLAMSGATEPSVIRIRIEKCSGVEVARLVQQVVDGAGDDLADGAAVSVTQAGIRVRRLPLP